MIQQKKLEAYKKTYQTISAPTYLEKQGLEDMLYKLEPRRNISRKYLYYSGFAFLSVVFLFVVTANASHPGDVLYPVKQLSKNFLPSYSSQIESKKLIAIPTNEPTKVIQHAMVPTNVPTPKVTVTPVDSARRFPSNNNTSAIEQLKQEVKGISDTIFNSSGKQNGKSKNGDNYQNGKNNEEHK